MTAKVHTHLVAFFAGAIAFVAPAFVFHAEAATYQGSPTPVSTSAGRTFTVSIDVESDRPYNAGSATIKFDPAFLSASRASKDGSSFSIWAVEPAISASAGTVTFEGGHTAPLSGKKKIISISFTAKKEGSTSITFEKGSILAGDGTGSDIFQASAAIPVSIAPGTGTPDPASTAKPKPVTEEEEVGNGELPELPLITSTTHPKEEGYSGAPTAKFAWELPLDVSIVRVEVDQSSSTVPKQTFDPAIADKEFREYVDGENWVHVRYKNAAGWGPTAHRKFLVDRVPPKEFSVTATVPERENNVTLAFDTSDDLSGLASYELVLDGGQPKKISLAELKDGKYPLLSIPNGSHSVKIVAIDNGGNRTEAEAAFVVNAPIRDEKTGEEEESAFPWSMVLIAFLFASIGGLTGMIWHERNSFRHDKFMTKREADEVRDRIASVFSALREEIDEQVARLYQKPNPSAEDREVTRRIHEAMDLSEELLAKEAEDVRKLLMH